MGKNYLFRIGSSTKSSVSPFAEFCKGSFFGDFRVGAKRITTHLLVERRGWFVRVLTFLSMEGLCARVRVTEGVSE